MSENLEKIDLSENQLLASIFGNLEWGNADVFALSSLGEPDGLGEIAGYLSMLDGKRRVRDIYLILPPLGERDRDTVGSQVRAGIRRAHYTMARDERATSIADSRFENLKSIETSSFSGENLISVISVAREYDVVIIADANEYRFAGVSVPLETVLDEDRWAPHLAHLMLAAERVARAHGSYILLVTRTGLPARQPNIDRLRDAGDVGLLELRVSVAMGAEEVVAFVEHLIDLVDRDRAGAALSLIENEVRLSKDQRWALEIDIFSRAGLRPRVQQLLQEDLPDTASLPATVLLRLAEIAAEADRDDLSVWLLDQSLPDLQSQSHLETALSVARRIERRPLVERVMIVLTNLHPESVVLRRQRGFDAVTEGKYEQASEIFEGLPTPKDRDRAQFYRALNGRIECGALKQPEALIENLINQFPDYSNAIRLQVIRSLERTDRRLDAIALLLDTDFSTEATWLTLASNLIEQTILAGELDTVKGTIPQLVDVSLRYLASHPTDGRVRTSIVDLLDASHLATLGPAILLRSVLERAGRPVTVRERTTVQPRSGLKDIESLPAVSRRVLDALAAKGEGVIVIAKHTVSRKELGADPDQVLAAILEFINFFEPGRRESVDTQVLHNLVIVAAAVAPLATASDEDLTVLRGVAIKLAVCGQSQAARDLAEQALALAGDSPPRRRQALFSFADIYARLGMTRESLLALAAGMEASDSVTWDEIWYELNLLFRLLRDLGLADRAIDLIPRCREALAAMGLEDVFGHRLDTFELQAKDQMRRKNAAPAEGLETLLADATKNAREALNANDELLPVTVFLRQLMNEARAIGLPGHSETQLVFDKLVEKLPIPHKPIALAISDNPTLEDVVAVAGGVTASQYADDTSYDLRLVRAIAKKLARSSIDSQDLEGFVFAAEALSDQGLQVWGRNGELVQPTRLLHSSGDPLTVASDLAQCLPIVCLARDEAGLMYGRLGGEGECRLDAVPTRVFETMAFKQWREIFPYGYRELGDDAFRESTASLGLVELPKRALFIAGELTLLPPNVMSLEGDLVGLNSAVATAPSLGWLRASIDADRQGDGSAAAWIPVASDLSDTETLSLLRDDIVDVLTDASVPLFTEPKPPSSFSRADLAILGAHGGLSHENQYFRSVSDDRHQPADIKQLVDLLHNSRVAILFVCSGGRHDFHPESGGAVGLARRLLGHGLSAVVAPSWPLEFLAVRPWLKAFLPAWNSGSPLIDSCHVANQEVARVSSYSLKRSLAMTLYGNPLVTIDGCAWS
ncbi:MULTISPECIES: hypothetical protein [Rhizobium]|uniref:CHAT domain-containing protein n=1 Tax=Rhizobium etli (strain CIAT 652) TaxID=491916 RepID=B3Q228_RHIE6|nr:MULTISPECIES: hypothetical protein [Rhizobium]ACE93734.1 hypothetical protein RHECIAT_PB0000008 [Rhizobium etli CIAT 652]UWU38819.1 hypothetical protein N2597_30820 [Rhizobium leguminosarum bv. phaseoli]ANK94029.1 hypothetical protein AMK01_PB00010 [Rhizobium sp. N6212]ANL00080.1 hypothetical protein AMK00_PB00010 [Rhizobium sp. N621]ANL06209.1 hypothetical protein AMJ99_PB00010 [Rhizobium esperanzae]